MNEDVIEDIKFNDFNGMKVYRFQEIEVENLVMM